MALPRAASSHAAGPILDVRRHSHHSGAKGAASDEEVKDIFAYGAGLQSTSAIAGLSDFTYLQTLSLHGNQIVRIEGLEVLHQLVTLNLSSNRIAWMEGLSQLKKLRVLNLSNNSIREIAGLQGLEALRTLILSHNKISLLGGLSALHGPPYVLQHLDFRDNIVEYLCELWILGGCSHLEEVVLQCGGYTNPVCKASAYRSTVLSVVPSIRSLDGSSCVVHAPTDIRSVAVPSLWAIHHSYPAPRVPKGNENHMTRSPCTGPTDSELQELQKSGSRGASNDKSPQRTVQCRHCLQETHESRNYNEIQANQVNQIADDDCAKPEHLKGSQRRARGRARSNAENRIARRIVDDAAVLRDSDVLVWNDTGEHEPGFHVEDGAWNVHPRNRATDDDELDKMAACGDNSRYVRFVGKRSKPALTLSQLRLPGATDQKTQTTAELATQTESVSKEVNHVRPNLSTITVVIDGNSSYTGIEKPRVLANSELTKKDNELLHLIKEKKLLEDEFVAFKKQADQERKHDTHVDGKHKSMILRSLEMNLKGCKLDLFSLRKSVMRTEKAFMAEAEHVESSIIKHVVLDDAVKLSASSAEIVVLKEALRSALNTCQTVGTTLNDANHQKEKAKRTLLSLTAALDEQRSKVKAVTEMLENSTHQERRNRRECTRLQLELDLVCQVLRKNKDRETEDLLGVNSAHWQAQGREEAERVWRQWRDEFHRRLVVTQTLIFQVVQENAKARSSVGQLRDVMIKKLLELQNAFEGVIEKEKGARELITELSFVVSAQKKRSEWMQLEFDRLAVSKQAVHEEVGRLQAEIVRLQERTSATEQKAMEAEALRQELANVISNSERERRATEEANVARFSSLMLENEKLAARASSLTYQIHETRDIIMAKTEVCENQEVTIEQLKEELEEAQNASCVSEASIKALETDLGQRLQYEVDQKHELCNELTIQENIISKMEDELKVSKAAKYGAEQACKALQEKVNNVDLMLRHVDEEINCVKDLYKGRERTISNERDDALAKITAMQKKLEDAEASATIAMKNHFESTKLIEAKEQKMNTTLIQKDILIEDLKRKVREIEAQLHSRDLALESQKAISIAKVEQLGKVLEELREVT